MTFDTSQARSLLAGEDVIYARYTASRDMRGVLVNTGVARRVLTTGRYRNVVSTGSAIALSFLPLANTLGARCHYIESATRVTGPSLTGRLLARVPGIHLYNQYPAWAGGRWRFVGSVFDAFTARPVTPPAAIRRVVVTLGTAKTFGFRRLVERLVAVLPPDAEVLWQTGCTDTGGLAIDARTAVGAGELDAAMRAADVVVCHAGTGSALGALEAGRCPVLVPRSAAHGEVVDGHQELLAAELTGRGLAVRADASELTLDHLRDAAGLRIDRLANPAPILLDGTGGLLAGDRAGLDDLAAGAPGDLAQGPLLNPAEPGVGDSVS